ncbi:protein lin-54 homolog isoform X2 [Vespa velutina]|uniref:protein lin-54 homolog isoform X1 n=1 Tax=Vespa crabro TaxID=7445 RepID=UPI001EFF7B9B|nr:protein lin-54 homolog isoform X1 [Vespa crabro]XP_046820014.1 protein lin-54 homolog isoform X1 [Vespa crabro]XP_046820015.1 protein lin-54 homolog isoform X1 [Vespa crabro]XP_046820016.1 protein lin-54 homolog isoform X1 [Vespa crabro]XP_046820017.1 protein lin-54 homolog isoform X1 [Vespa crabro]XP_047347947.1 protein lin-54 homolog isoform X2 [Vespa velutina]
MSLNKGQNARALVEPLALDSRTLGDGDLSALTLSHNNEQYTSNDFEAFANIQAELECMNAEEVMATDEEQVMIEQNIEAETIVPDVEMSEVSEQIQAEEIVFTSASQNNQNIIFQTKPSLQRVPVSAVQVKQNICPATQSQSIMIVSPASGQGTSQILKISHPASASTGQLQSIAQTLITAKPADGSVLQLRSTQANKPVMATSHSGSITLSNIQNVKTVQTTKRSVQSNQQNRNVYTKMILAGSQAQPGQQVLITSSQNEIQPAQTIKFLSSNVSSQNITSPTKTITLAQAQQMGLLTTNKVQHILPSTPQKQGIIVNKVVQSSSSQSSKMTIVPSSAVKSPTKILPAPIINSQVKASTISNQQSVFSSSTKTNVQPSPQKVIIRQSSLKPGTVLGSGQVIRIPANQNIVTGSSQVHQIQMPGRQVQYVRLVSTPSSGSTNVVTVGKSKPQTQTLQTVGVSQKLGGQQQIVKVVPLNTSNQSLRTVAPKTTLTGSGQRLLIPAAATVGSQSKNAVAIPASALSQLASGQAVLSANSNVSNIVVLPAQYIQQQHTDDGKIKSQQSTPNLLGNTQSLQSPTSNLTSGSISESKVSQRSYANVEPNGIRPRKPCNCTKSQCLKLYCDCFANGEFCHMCNCNNCSNNLGNEEERQRAIKSCLERNPNAFRPKIGKGRETGDDIRRHNKGCNCKRSGCLKNYCECYEAKIPCSANCKCIGCRNIEEPNLEKKSLKDLADAAEVRTAQLTLNKAKLQLSEMAFRPPAVSNTGARQPFNFLTDKVVEMTCQCLMAQAYEAERDMFDDETSQRLIIEEFGRCLKEIIESAHKAEAT